MYHDPITPRSHPDLLANPDYDPFEIMPASFPPAPRVFATEATLSRARQRLQAGLAHDTACFERLLKACRLDEPLPELKPPSGPPDWGGGSLTPWLSTAFLNALAGALSGNARHNERAKQALLLAAEACPGVAASWTGHEHHEAVSAARAYDLLAASGLTHADDKAIRGLLEQLVEAMDHSTHRACNNHNSMQMTGRLSLAAALGNMAYVHDTLYGFSRNRPWCYGLAHLLRHDFLSDGMQWEGAAGYHMLVLGMVCECFSIMENLGSNLWHKAWPSLRQNDSQDEHRGWGPKCLKPFTSAIDALLYQAFGNGDYSLLHDQILGNLRGTESWRPLFFKIYSIYRDPRYAWALRHINKGKPYDPEGPIPAWFQGANGTVEFARLDPIEIPEGEHPLKKDRAFAPLGRYVSGCSLFEMHGAAFLRSNPTNPNAPGAHLYFGPHWAGHRAPAALHLDIHAYGRRLATAPHHFGVGYEDTRYRTWNRATSAHNTISVDEASMFPYDFPSDSLWECDIWRDTISDGELLLFQPGKRFHAVRARNDNVYAGVTLDRTVILAGKCLLDVFRVTAEKSRLLDWTMHVAAEFNQRSDEPFALPKTYGYQHLAEPRLLKQTSGWSQFPFHVNRKQGSLMLWLDGAPDSRLIMAKDPAPDEKRPIGASEPTPESSCIIQRSRTDSALFVAAWRFDNKPLAGGNVLGSPNSDLQVSISTSGKTMNWLLPMQGDVRLMRADKAKGIKEI